MERIIDIISDVSPSLPKCQSTDSLPPPGETDAKYTISSILKFLCFLLKSAKDKRHFLSFQVFKCIAK
jgi:hypothetical protein